MEQSGTRSPQSEFWNTREKWGKVRKKEVTHSMALAAFLCVDIHIPSLPLTTSTSSHFVQVFAGPCASGTIRPDLPVHIALPSLGTLLSAALFTARWLGAWTARWNEPIWGPVVTQIGISVPIVGLCVVLARPRLVSPSSK